MLNEFSFAQIGETETPVEQNGRTHIAADQQDKPSIVIHRRREERVDTRIRGLLYHGGNYQTTLIENISTKGVGLKGAAGIIPGDNIAIQLLDGRELAGEVMWWVGGRCGVALHEPLSADDHLFKRQRAYV